MNFGRMRGNFSVKAALSEEIKEQIRQKVQSLLSDGSAEEQPQADNAQAETASHEPAAPDETAADLTETDNAAPAAEQPETAEPEGYVVDNDVTSESASDYFDFGDSDGDGSFEDDFGDMPSLLPPKSRREQQPHETPAEPAPAEKPASVTETQTTEPVTAPEAKEESSDSEPSMEVKNPGKNTDVPTLTASEHKAFNVSASYRRGRFDVLAARGQQTRRKDKDVKAPEKGDKRVNNPGARSPSSKKIRDTVKESKAADADIGKDKDMRKD